MGVQLGGVREGLIADLVKGIGGVGDQLTQENLLVGVDSVDDQREQLRDLSLELESLGHGGGGYSEEGRSRLDLEKASESEGEDQWVVEECGER